MHSRRTETVGVDMALSCHSGNGCMWAFAAKQTKREQGRDNRAPLWITEYRERLGIREMRWRFAVAVLATMGLSPVALAASFDCNKAAKPHEKIICADPALSKADEALAQAYTRLMADLPAALKPALQKSQRSWLAYGPLTCSSDGRGTIKDKAAFAQCLKTEYDNRLTTLKQQPGTVGTFRTLAVTEFQAMPSSSNDPEFFPIVTHDKTVTIVFGGDENVANQLNNWLQSMAAPEKAGWNDAETTASVTVALAQANSVFASAMINSEIFGVGAAHPVSMSFSAHLVLASGKPLTFRDMFSPAASAKLVALSWAQLKKKLGKDMMVEKPADIAKLVTDPSHWLIGPDGLTIAFNVYEVAAYVMGPQDITLPWTALRNELTALGQSVAAATR